MTTLKERNTRVAVVSVDSVEENKRVATKHGFEFSLLSDPDLTVIDLFGVRHPKGGVTGDDIARPAVFIVNAEGKITWKNLTSNWRVRIRPETILEQTKGFQ